MKCTSYSKLFVLSILAMTIKRKIETKYRLPNLNWIVLKPQQVKGTIFCELDDEKLFNLIDFDTFEELFKTGPAFANNQNSSNNNANFKVESPVSSKKMIKKNENLTLLDAQRQRNLAISRRKIEMGVPQITKAINKFVIHPFYLTILHDLIISLFEF